MRVPMISFELYIILISITDILLHLETCGYYKLVLDDLIQSKYQYNTISIIYYSLEYLYLTVFYG